MSVQNSSRVQIQFRNLSILQVGIRRSYWEGAPVTRDGLVCLVGVGQSKRCLLGLLLIGQQSVP